MTQQYFKKKSKRWVRFAMFIKGVTGTIGMSALIVDYKWIGIAILVAGAISNEAINTFGTPEKEDEEPGAP